MSASTNCSAGPRIVHQGRRLGATLQDQHTGRTNGLSELRGRDDSAAVPSSINVKAQGRRQGFASDTNGRTPSSSGVDERKYQHRYGNRSGGYVSGSVHKSRAHGSGQPMVSDRINVNSYSDNEVDAFLTELNGGIPHRRSHQTGSTNIYNDGDALLFTNSRHPKHSNRFRRMLSRQSVQPTTTVPSGSGQTASHSADEEQNTEHKIHVFTSKISSSVPAKHLYTHSQLCAIGISNPGGYCTDRSKFDELVKKPKGAVPDGVIKSDQVVNLALPQTHAKTGEQSESAREKLMANGHHGGSAFSMTKGVGHKPRIGEPPPGYRKEPAWLDDDITADDVLDLDSLKLPRNRSVAKSVNVDYSGDRPTLMGSQNAAHVQSVAEGNASFKPSNNQSSEGASSRLALPSLDTMKLDDILQMDVIPGLSSLLADDGTNISHTGTIESTDPTGQRRGESRFKQFFTSTSDSIQAEHQPTWPVSASASDDNNNQNLKNNAVFGQILSSRKSPVVTSNSAKIVCAADLEASLVGQSSRPVDSGDLAAFNKLVGLVRSSSSSNAPAVICDLSRPPPLSSSPSTSQMQYGMNRVTNHSTSDQLRPYYGETATQPSPMVPMSVLKQLVVQQRRSVTPTSDASSTENISAATSVGSGHVGVTASDSSHSLNLLSSVALGQAPKPKAQSDCDARLSENVLAKFFPAKVITASAAASPKPSGPV